MLNGFCFLCSGFYYLTKRGLLEVFMFFGIRTYVVQQSNECKIWYFITQEKVLSELYTSFLELLTWIFFGF